MALWYAAWLQGYVDQHKVYQRTEDTVVTRWKPVDLLNHMWRRTAEQPANLIRDVLEPVADEICSNTDLVVEAKSRRVKYKGGKLDKIIDLQITVHSLVGDNAGEIFDDKVKRIASRRVVAAEQALREVAPKKSRAWRKPVMKRAPKQVEMALDGPSNVVSLPIDKMRPAFAEDPNEGRLAFVRPPGHYPRKEE